MTVLDYLLHAGSENVVIYFRDNLYLIKTLKEFQFVDEYGKDQGANVRQKAKDITNLLTDEARLRQERRSRAHMRDRMVGSTGRHSADFEGDTEDENVRRRSRSLPPRRTNGRADDDELRRAIEESKRSLAEEEARKGTLTAEERDLLQAIKLSEEEERKRNEAVEKANERALFDENNQLYAFHIVDLILTLSNNDRPEYPRPRHLRIHSRSSTLDCSHKQHPPSSNLNSPLCLLNTRLSTRTNSKRSRRRFRFVILDSRFIP